MINPTGYYVLVKMEILEKDDEELVEGSSLIVAAPEAKKENQQNAEREQARHYRGTLVSIGPTAWSGYAGCDAETPEGRAAEWGVKIGAVIRFQSYDGVDEGDEYRLVQDGHVIGVEV